MHSIQPDTMPRVLCRLFVTLLLIATVGVLAGCGRGSRTTAATSTPASRAPSVPASGVGHLTKTQAVAVARAINLTAADVPGFTPSEHKLEHETAAQKQIGRELRHCVGGTLNSRANLIEASSKNFKLERGLIDLRVSSEVSVSRTPARAGKELKGIRSNHVRGCLSRYLNQLLKEQSRATVSSVSITQGTPPAPGATGSFAWLITAKVTVHKIKLPFYIDILGFVYGPTEVSLRSSGALKPFPAPIQEQLYRLLLKRAETHSL